MAIGTESPVCDGNDGLVNGKGPRRQCGNQVNGAVMSLASTASPAKAPGIVILGMHRSGTSCLTGSLQQCGLYLGQVHEWNPHNRKGNRESQRITALNDAVLDASGGRWDEPPATLRWTPAHAAERDDIIARLQGDAPGPWGFKDPRTVLTLPFWQGGSADVRLVGTYRHPWRVARSLHARGGMPFDQGLELWRQYNARQLDYRRHHRFPLLSFDLPDGEYRAAVARLASALGLEPGLPATGEGFFEPGLRTAGQETDGPALPPSVAAVLERLEQEAGS
jgi:hypothetical protein